MNKKISYFFLFIAMLTALMPQPVNASVEEAHLLEFAIQKNDNELIEILLKYGGDPSFPALNKAMEANDYQSVKLLIEYGVDINSRATEVKEILEKLKNGSVYSVGTGETVLEKAVKIKRFDLIEYFLIKGADSLNPRIYNISSGSDGRSALMSSDIKTSIYEAIMTGSSHTLKIFKEHDTNLDDFCLNTYYYSNNKRYIYSPLQAAIKLNKRECVEFLLSVGARL